VVRAELAEEKGGSVTTGETEIGTGREREIRKGRKIRRGRETGRGMIEGRETETGWVVEYAVPMYRHHHHHRKMAP
jgi:hypothetical protein